MKNPLKDSRYQVAKEFTGAHKPAKGLQTGERYVARFCGDFIAARETETEAWAECVIHDDSRTTNIL